MSPSQSSPGPWPGRFVWHDLMTKDAAKAAKFYGALFDWQIQAVPMQGKTYHMIHCGPGPIGGIMQEDQIPMSHWMPHLAVVDVDAAVKKLQGLGGAVCMPPTDIPQTGRFAIVGDPQGAYFSMYQGLPGSFGFDPDLGIPGRICWNEVYTSDDIAGQKFYSTMFGWRDEPKDIGPMGTYHIQMLGDKQAGGLMKNPMPPDSPSCWVVYFFVLDLLAATDKAKQLGATPMMENTPIPGVGSFAMLLDPTGAVFALFQPNTTPC